MNKELRAKLITVAEENSHPDDPSHDFSHILRVLKNVETIAESEGGDFDILIPSALFHDVINIPKDDPRADQASNESAEWTIELLKTFKEFPQAKFPAVFDAISKCSFSKGIVPELLESKILQDADGLDSTGAISIMRTCSSCGVMKRAFYDLDDPFYEVRDKYKGPAHFGVDLFYRILLVVESRIHTETAKKIAKRRTEFLRTFLDELRVELGE